MNAAIYSLFISLALRMTVVTVFVMLIKLIFRDRLSAAAHCAIWVILLAQSAFCLGNIKIHSKTSIYNVVPESVIVNLQQNAADAVSHIDIRNVIALIYVLGMAAFAAWYIGVFVIHSIKVKRSETVTDAVTLEILRDVKYTLGITDPIVLKRGSYAHTILNTVVLPNGYAENEQRQILLHELCHHKHKDNMKLWAAVIVICLNWFNPLVWIAFRRFRRDIEMYCDDSVLKLTDSKKEYARVLVKTACDHIRFVPGVVGAANGTHEVAKRVRRIAAWKKKKPVWLIIAMLSSVCVSCLCLTDEVSIAVTDKAAEIMSTPEPIDIMPAITEVGKPTAEPTPAATAPAAVKHDAAHATAAPSVRTVSQTPKPANTVVPPTSAPESKPQPTESSVTPKTPADVPESEPEQRREVSANGNKETYSRDDGKTVVLQYDGDDLQTGYIIDGGE